MKKPFMSFIITSIMVGLVGCSSGDNIKFATDATYAPMEFMDKDQITGFDIDFLAEVMKEADIAYDIKNIGWDTMLESVKQGKEYKGGISSVSITDERKETYDFSAPYFESTNMIMVRADSPVKSALDLKDLNVAVQGATTADTLMSGIMGQTNSNLKRFDTNTLALMDLSKGGADAVVADVAIIREYIKNNPNSKLVGILDPVNFDSEYYGMIFPKGSDLKAKIDPAIKKVIENGKYTEIYTKWFGEAPDTTNLLK